VRPGSAKLGGRSKARSGEVRHRWVGRGWARQGRVYFLPLRKSRQSSFAQYREKEITNMTNEQQPPLAAGSAVRPEVLTQIRKLVERARWALCERNWTAVDDSLAEIEVLCQQQSAD